VCLTLRATMSPMGEMREGGCAISWDDTSTFAPALDVMEAKRIVATVTQHHLLTVRPSKLRERAILLYRTLGHQVTAIAAISAQPPPDAIGRGGDGTTFEQAEAAPGAAAPAVCETWCTQLCRKW